MTKRQITVKIISRIPQTQWLRYFPDLERMEVGGCRFTFGEGDRDYDWVVVYNDLPKGYNSLGRFGSEKLACSQDNTLLVVAEPETVKQYHKAFSRQFSHILTSQTKEALPHPGRIYSQPALIWFYGWGFDGAENLDWHALNADCREKNKEISTVCSSKQQKHTLHNQRYRLTEELRQYIPNLEVFGHGVQMMRDKAESLDDYRYHIAIENYIGKHHWTEKLSDSFLGCCLPFYSGCTNLGDYFPEDSFVEIDLFDAQKTAEIIRQAVGDNLYEKRLPAIREARRLVLEEYSFFRVVANIVQQRHSDAVDRNALLYNGAAIRARKPLSTLPEVAMWELKKMAKRVGKQRF